MLDVPQSDTNYVVSVMGGVPATALHRVDAHNHLWIAPAAADAPRHDDFEAILAELKLSPAIAQLDCQPLGAGRNALVLHDLATQSGVTVVCCTGYHLRRYHAPDDWLYTVATAEQAAAFFIRELTVGVEESPVRAGFIKIAFEEDPTQMPEALLEAVGEAVRVTGCMVEIHTERGIGAEKILVLMLDKGIPVHRLVLCHMDKRKDRVLHHELIGTGVLLEYDTFNRPKYGDAWQFLSTMIEAGDWHGIALATDSADKDLWAYRGGAGIGVFHQYEERLSVDDTNIIDALLGGNIVRRLIWSKE